MGKVATLHMVEGYTVELNVNGEGWDRYAASPSFLYYEQAMEQAKVTKETWHRIHSKPARVRVVSPYDGSIYEV